MGEGKTVLVTGANGFVGRNLVARLEELGRYRIIPILRSSTEADWLAAVTAAEVVVHLAGIIRSPEPGDFGPANLGSTKTLAGAIEVTGKRPPILFASTAKVLDPIPYGATKKAAEEMLLDLSARTGVPVALYHLPHIFGKGGRPNHNSVVVTLCHDHAAGQSTKLNDPAARLPLIYADDLVASFVAAIDSPPAETRFIEASPVYEITVGAAAELIQGFRPDRRPEPVPGVEPGLLAALYATYVSFLPAAAQADQNPRRIMRAAHSK